MKIEDIFDSLSDKEIQNLAEDFHVLSKKEKERIYAMSERKYNDTAQHEIEVQGVERYSRPKWYRFAAIAATFAVIISGIGGAGWFLFSSHGTPDDNISSDITEQNISVDTAEAQNPTEPSATDVSDGYLDYEAIAEHLTGEFVEFVYVTEAYELDYSDTLNFTVTYDDGQAFPETYARLADERFSSRSDIIEYAESIFTDEYISDAYSLKSNDLQGYKNFSSIPASVFYANDSMNTLIDYDGKLYARDNKDSVLGVSFWADSSIECIDMNDRSFYAKRTVNVLTPLDTGKTTADVYFYIVNIESGWKIDEVLNEEEYEWKMNSENSEQDTIQKYKDTARSLLMNYWEYMNVFRYPDSVDRSDVINFNDKPYHRFTNENYKTLEDLEKLLENTFTDDFIINNSYEIGTDMSAYNSGDTVDEVLGGTNFILYNGQLYCNEPGISRNPIDYDEWINNEIEISKITENSFRASEYHGENKDSFLIVMNDLGEWRIQTVRENIEDIEARYTVIAESIFKQYEIFSRFEMDEESVNRLFTPEYIGNMPTNWQTEIPPVNYTDPEICDMTENSFTAKFYFNNPEDNLNKTTLIFDIKNSDGIFKIDNVMTSVSINPNENRLLKFLDYSEEYKEYAEITENLLSKSLEFTNQIHSYDTEDYITYKRDDEIFRFYRYNGNYFTDFEDMDNKLNEIFSPEYTANNLMVMVSGGTNNFPDGYEWTNDDQSRNPLIGISLGQFVTYNDELYVYDYDLAPIYILKEDFYNRIGNEILIENVSDNGFTAKILFESADSEIALDIIRMSNEEYRIDNVQ